MGNSSRVRTAGVSVVAAALLAGVSACDHRCGLGEHARLSVTSAQTGPVAGNGGAAYQDLPLRGATSDAEFSLSNTSVRSEAGGVDAYLVPTSCSKLFDGPYPGGTPLCPIYLGPAKPGGVSARAKLDPGQYRLYLQGFSNVSAPVSFFVDVYIWDYSCRPLIP